MKLGEALKAVAAARSLPVARDGFLVCGFEPLHLPVFLQARFQAREPGHALRVSHGLFGDLVGNVERARVAAPAVAWVVLEWNDLDPRAILGAGCPAAHWLPAGRKGSVQEDEGVVGDCIFRHAERNEPGSR